MLERVEMTRRNVVVDGKVYSVKRESEQGVQFAQPEIVSGYSARATAPINPRASGFQD
jgi:hypothetical protein